MEPAFSILHFQEPTTYPCPEPDQSSPCLHPISWKSILILPFNLRLGIPSGLFPSGLPTNYSTHLYSHPRLLYVPKSHYSCFDHPNDFRRRIHIKQLLATWPIPPLVTSPLLGLNIFLSTLFSNTLSLCSSLIVRCNFHTPVKQQSYFMCCWPCILVIFDFLLPT